MTRSVNLIVRVTPEERELLRKAAEADPRGRTLSEIVREMVMEWATRSTEERRG